MLCATDYENLVAEIYKKPALWDGSHPDHHYRQLVERHWEEIGDIIGLTKVDCRKKWKYFKDQYRKELRRELGSPIGFESQWPLYRHMSFLKKQMERSITENPPQLQQNLFNSANSSSNCCNTSPTQDLKDYEISNDNSSYFQSNLCKSSSTLNKSSSSNGAQKTSTTMTTSTASTMTTKRMAMMATPSISNRKRKLDDITERFLQLEEKKTAMLNKLYTEKDETESSDDILFFRSLLPFMRKFDDVQKLKVRNKIQAVILSELEGGTSSVIAKSGEKPKIEYEMSDEFSRCDVRNEENLH